LATAAGLTSKTHTKLSLGRKKKSEESRTQFCFNLTLLILLKSFLLAWLADHLGDYIFLLS